MSKRLTSLIVRRVIIIFLMLSLNANWAIGQAKGILFISGTVLSELGEPLPGISVLVKGTGEGVVTDLDGQFQIEAIAKGNITLVFTGVGFEVFEKPFVFNQSLSKIEITLSTSVTELEGVQVLGKSELTQVRELPYAVSVIDVRPLQVQNLDVNQVLGTVSGVRIREEGGLGSAFDFSLNGFSGKQVKFFMDGVPMEGFGSSLSLNNIPINLISGIEVYKGVVPVHLGADALGGAINVLTHQHVKNYLNVSYALGSFNTHRASILAQFTESRIGLTVSANLFYNYSDNNYWMKNVEVPRSDGTGKLDTVNVRRFHDGYQSKTIQMEVGFVNKSFADRIFIGLISSGNEKEVQTGVNFQQVFGEVVRTDKVLMPTFKYKKSNLFVQGLDVSAFAMYNMGKAESVDTSSMKYDWYGKATRRTNNAGEYSYNKSLFSFNDDNSLATANLSYRVGKHHSFSINNTFTRFIRVGKDPLRPSNELQFRMPNTLIRNVMGVSYGLNLWEDKWKSSVFAKVFKTKSRTFLENVETGNYENYQTSFSNQGYGAASTVFVTEWLQFKVSYEHTYRLPDGEELFGDGLNVQPNTTLRPEKSNNYNIGLLLSKALKHHSLQFETQYLLRHADDLIWQAPGPQFSSYSNLDKAQLTSYEVAAKYRFKTWLDFQVNLTKQKNINTDKSDTRYLDDLPNQPFFFWNTNLGLNLKDVGLKGSRLSLSWFTQYVALFYWKWPSQGTKKTKYDIPTQLSHDFTASYSMVDGRYNASFTCSNVTDALRYDNFALQKPGRAFSFKLSYYLTY